MENLLVGSENNDNADVRGTCGVVYLLSTDNVAFWKFILKRRKSRTSSSTFFFMDSAVKLLTLLSVYDNIISNKSSLTKGVCFMRCEACGANAEEIRPNHYRCKYCTHEFDGPAATDNYGYAGAPTANAPQAPAGGISYINGGIPINGVNATQAKDKAGENTRVLSGEEIYDCAINGVVEIYAANQPKGGEVSSASGFVVSSQGFIITNAHAVLDSYGQVYKYIQINARGKMYKAMVVATGKPADGKHDSVDLCLLYVEGLRVKPNAIGEVNKLKNGQKVYLIGNSLGAGICITSGIISDKERGMPGLSYPYIMTDAAANPGNSGGPLYNERGEVIGVLVAGIDHAKGMNYAIPANVLEAFLAHVINSSKFKNVDLGELNKYAKNYTSYGMTVAAVSTAFTGIKLLMDVIEFIVGLFSGKR